MEPLKISSQVSSNASRRSSTVKSAASEGIFEPVLSDATSPSNSLVERNSSINGLNLQPLRCTRCKHTIKINPVTVEDGTNQLVSILTDHTSLLLDPTNPGFESNNFHDDREFSRDRRSSHEDQSFILIPSLQKSLNHPAPSEPVADILPNPTNVPSLELRYPQASVVSAEDMLRPKSAANLEVSPFQNSLPSQTPSSLLAEAKSSLSMPSNIPKMSLHLGALERIHSIINDVSLNLQLPLCTNCAMVMKDLMRKQVGELEEELQCYQSFLKMDQEQTDQYTLHGIVDGNGFESLIAQEEALENELKLLEDEEERLQAESGELQAESDRLDDEEAQYWFDLNTFQQDLVAFQTERDALNTKYDSACQRLERLKRTNVYNDVFRIWHDGVFGTINGFRLGRHPNQPVEWNEINAGWGQACLLLDTLARKLYFEFSCYRLLPMGSFSKIQKIATPNNGTPSDTGRNRNAHSSSLSESARLASSYAQENDSDSTVISTFDLYGSGDFVALGRLLFNRRFDQGLVAFLQCVHQLGNHCERLDDGFQLPYRIHKDKIGDVSIKIGFNRDEAWSRACKYMLTNLKWILAFVTKRALVG